LSLAEFGIWPNLDFGRIWILAIFGIWPNLEFGQIWISERFCRK
jgi:hypothetical protein